MDGEHALSGNNAQRLHIDGVVVFQAPLQDLLQLEFLAEYVAGLELRIEENAYIVFSSAHGSQLHMYGKQTVVRLIRLGFCDLTLCYRAHSILQSSPSTQYFVSP